MITRIAELIGQRIMLSLLLALLVAVAGAQEVQAPQDALPPGVVAVEPAEPSAAVYSSDELAELVGPIALYPDDLVAIVLPASTYPLQLVQAARFLERLEGDASLKPDPDWDESVVALLNYPQVIRLLNEDLDWTWRLGEAVLAQQADVIEAIEQFRDRAWLAGNLRSDDRQTITRDEGVVRITPADPQVIYVPYYEPRRVVYYSPLPVYHYYPLGYPSYYYPYPAGYGFSSGFFWGVTSAFAIGWSTHYIHVHHYGFPSHPYYGRSYYDRYFYRRPVVRVDYRRPPHGDRSVRLHTGNRWRPADRPGARPHRLRAGPANGGNGQRNNYRARNVRPDGRQPRFAAPLGDRSRSRGARTTGGNQPAASRSQPGNRLAARDQRARPGRSASAIEGAGRRPGNGPQPARDQAGARVSAAGSLQTRQDAAARGGTPGNLNRPAPSRLAASGNGSPTTRAGNRPAVRPQRQVARPVTTAPGAVSRDTRPAGRTIETRSGLGFAQTPRSAGATAEARPARRGGTLAQRNAPAAKRFAAPAARSTATNRPATRVSPAVPSERRAFGSAASRQPQMARPASPPQRVARSAAPPSRNVAATQRVSPPAAAPRRQAAAPPAQRPARQSGGQSAARSRPGRAVNARPRRDR